MLSVEKTALFGLPKFSELSRRCNSTHSQHRQQMEDKGLLDAPATLPYRSHPSTLCGHQTCSRPCPFLESEHRSPSLQPSGHYMYRTVVTICTTQWSLYVPHSGHYMYRTVVTICTAQWSLYVPHSGHYMYRTVVTICTAQWSLYVPPGLTFNNSTFTHTVYLCVLCGSENKQRLFPYTALTDWFL